MSSCSRLKMHVIIFLIVLFISSCSSEFDFDDKVSSNSDREALLKYIPVFFKRAYAEWSTKTTCNELILRSSHANLKTKAFQWFNYKVRLPRRTSTVLEARILLEFYKISGTSNIDDYNYSIEISSKNHNSSTHVFPSCEKVISDNMLELFFDITEIYQDAKDHGKNVLQLRFRFQRSTINDALLVSQDPFFFKEVKAFLVTYEDNKNCHSFSKEVDWHSRRVLKFAKKTGKRRRSEPQEAKMDPYPVQHSYMKTCRLIDWHVPFESIGWDEFIYMPEGINANACSGVCGFPIKGNSTEHAMLQSVVSARYDRITTACCVPVSTRHVTLILYDKPDNIFTMSDYSMIADTCGCR